MSTFQAKMEAIGLEHANFPFLFTTSERVERMLLAATEGSGKIPGVVLQLGEINVGYDTFDPEEIPLDSMEILIKKKFPGGANYIWMEDGIVVHAVEFDCGLRTQTVLNLSALAWPETPPNSTDCQEIPKTSRYTYEWPEKFNDSSILKPSAEHFAECENKWKLMLRIHLLLVMWHASPKERERFWALEDVQKLRREVFEKQQVMRVTYNEGEYDEFTMDMNVSDQRKGPTIVSHVWGVKGKQIGQANINPDYTYDALGAEFGSIFCVPLPSSLLQEWSER